MAQRWWIVLRLASAGAGQLTASFTEAAKAPAKKGTVWGVFGPWPTRAAAEQAWKDGSYQNHAAVPPGDSSPVINTIVSGNPEGNQGGTSGSGSSGFAGLLAKLGQPVFWLRAAEVVVGAVLLIVAIGKMTGAGSTVLQVAKTAKGAVL